MNLLECAWQLASEEAVAGRTLRLPPAAVDELGRPFGGSIDRLMLGLIPLASRLAQPRLSGFRVGAVALGSSGTLYLGANLELDDSSLAQTVHAEQAAVTGAVLGGETGVERLAVSAPPCGYCRQFLYELATASRLQILLADRPPTPLVDLLPGAFGPADLGVVGGLAGGPRSRLEWVSSAPGPAAEAAMAAAELSYAPYTGAVAGLGLVVRPRGGEVDRAVRGPYLENAAFNPSLSPLQTALIALSISGLSDAEISGAALVQLHDTKVAHADAARSLLSRLAPQLTLEVCTIRRA